MLRRFAFGLSAVYSLIKTFEFSRTDNDFAFYLWIGLTVVFIILSGPSSKSDRLDRKRERG